MGLGLSSAQGIARAALILMMGSVASRLLGVVREQVVAGLFGATAATDAFTAASRLPTTVYDLLIGGMISAALIPIFTDYVHGPRAELSRLVSSVVNLLVVLLAVVLAGLYLLAPWLMQFYAAGFDADTQRLAVELVRFMLPAVLFMGISGVLTALLYARRRFGLPALALSGYNGGIVLGALAFYQPLGIGSLVAGVVGGALLQLVAQIFAWRGIDYRWGWDLGQPALRRLITLYLPVAAGLVVSAIGIAIDSNLASRTGQGNMAAMRFATTLVQFPLGLVAAAASFALLPVLSRQASALAGRPQPGAFFEPARQEAALGDQPSFLTQAAPGAADPPLAGEYKVTLALGIKGILLLIVPATIGLAVLRQPLIHLLFEHGAFDAEATTRTATAFLYYALGLPAAAVDQLLIFAFYARKNTVTPVLVGVVGVLIYLTSGLALLGPMGMPGLALANSIQWTGHALIMVGLLWRSLGGLGQLGLGVCIAKVVAAALGMGAALALVMAGYPPPSGNGGLAVYLGLTTLGGAGLYGALLGLLRLEEGALLWQMIKARLGR